MTEISPKQKITLTFIIKHIENKGYPPTVREIAFKYSITQRAAHDRIKALEKKGFIKVAENEARAIKVLKTPTGKAIKLIYESGEVINLGRS